MNQIFRAGRMHRRLGPALLLGSLMAGSARVAAQVVMPPGFGGLEVVGVQGEAARAGMQAGDRLVAWSGTDASGSPVNGMLPDPIVLHAVRWEYLPFGEVTLHARRDGGDVQAAMGIGDWGLAVLPDLGIEVRDLWMASREDGNALADVLEKQPGRSTRETAWMWAEAATKTPDPVLQDRRFQRALAYAGDASARSYVLWRQGYARLHARRMEDAAASFEAAYEAAEPDGLAAAQYIHEAGVTWHQAGDLARAEAGYARAVAIRENRAPRSLDLAMTCFNLGLVARIRDDYAGARAWYQRSLELREAARPDSTLVAVSLSALAGIASQEGELDEAEKLALRSLRIRERVAPDSLELSKAWVSLGLLAARRGDVAAAAEWYERALSLQERLAPDGIDLAATANNLGIVEWQRGDFRRAEELYQRALRVYEAQAPASQQVAALDNNLGGLAQLRGNLAAAEMWHHRALDIRLRLAPESLDTSASYNNLGKIAADRQDLEAAEAWHRKALAIREAKAPGSDLVAASLIHLGNVADARMDRVAARQWYERAWALREAEDPRGLGAATCANNLGVLAEHEERWEEAERWHLLALSNRERVAPRHPDTAESAYNLGVIQHRQENFTAAEGWYRKALAILKDAAPGSAAEASSLMALARCLVRQGRSAEALETYQSALASLENQQSLLGGSPADLGAFRAHYEPMYRELCVLLLGMGKASDAFSVQESGRARALLALLAERDLVDQDLPAALRREQILANAEWTQTVEEMSRAEHEDERRALQGKLDDVILRQREIERRIRAQVPRLAQLRYPAPASLAQVQAALPVGAAFVAFSPGPGGTAVFVATRRASLAYLAPLTEDQIGQHVRRLRLMVQSPDLEPARVAEAAAPLGELLAPAENLLRRVRTMILAPGGPLWHVPVAVLPDPCNHGHALVERIDLALTPSATVWLQQREQGAPAPQGHVSAFGDPALEGAHPAQQRRGADLGALPGARAEVKAIQELYGADAFLGDQATEAHLRSAVPVSSTLHVAVHGWLDPDSPMESALVLAGAQDSAAGSANDGLLQVWEIFEGVRCPSSLVVLSACESGLGRDLRGEGLEGLARAFQYAGARSLVVSLWNIRDETTAPLMKDFYARLMAGDSPAQSLRWAQQQARKDPARAHPLHWAGFVVLGAS